MDKFWKWMEGKEIYYRDSDECRFECGCKGILSEQMIIGYMIEYLFDTGNAHIIDLIPIRMNDFKTDNYYAWLKNFVEAI